MSYRRKRPDLTDFSRTRVVSALLFAGVLFLGIFLALDMASEEAEAVGGSNIIVSIYFEESYGDVNVKPGSVPITSFKGLVRASRDAGSGRIDINLRAVTSRVGFLASVAPMQLSLNPSLGQNAFYEITLDVLAPLRANYTDGEWYPPVGVTVEGDWLAYPSGIQGQLMNSTVMVTVNQFYDLSVSVDPPFFKGLPGSSAWFDVWIKNMGNGIDSFELSIVNDEWYADMGFSFVAETWQIDVPPNQEGKIRLHVQSPYTFSVYESSVYAITLKITSKGSKMYENNMNPRNTIYDLTFHAKGSGAVLYFSVEFIILAIGVLLVLGLTVFNGGIFVKGLRKGVKMPVRTYWSAKLDRLDKWSRKRQAAAAVRRKEKDKIKAQRKAEQAVINEQKRAERERIKAQQQAEREALREERRKQKDAEREEKNREKNALKEEKARQKEQEREEKRLLKEKIKEEKRLLKEARAQEG